MSINDQHCLDGVKFLASPNYNQRPNVMDISMVVIHNISLPPDVYGGDFIEKFFLNKLDNSQHPYFKTLVGIEVSAHLLIKRSGEVIQFVPFNKRAWHAGQSKFRGRHNCNDFSIGIELEGSDNIAYEDKQYQQLKGIITQLKMRYPIFDIVGHNQIAPERKTDPGKAFDWAKLE